MADNARKNNSEKRESLLVTKESLCAASIIFSALAFLILCTRSMMFGELGLAVHSFLTGAFGYLAYPLVLGLFYLSVMGLVGKRLVKNRKLGFLIAVTLFFAALIVHTSLTFTWEREGYLAACFFAGESFPGATVTGWLGGVVVYAVSAVLSNIGAILFFSAMTVFFGYLCVASVTKPSVKEPKAKENKAKAPAMEAGQASAPVYPQQPSYNAYEGYNAPAAETAQRPMVRLREEYPQPKEEEIAPSLGAFSPFGTPAMMQEQPEEPRPVQGNSHEFLFSGSPADNYKTNLIFDPNSSANKRPPVDPTEAAAEYMPSYTDAYQNAVNEQTEKDRPVMIVNDNTNFTQPSYEPEEPSLGKMDYLADEKPEPLQTVDYPAFDTPPAPIYEPEEPKMAEPSVGFGFGAREETPAPKEEQGYRRHEYMDLFSPSNPRLFESENDPFTRGREERFPERGEREIPESRDTFGGRGFAEEPRDTFGGRDTEERGRSALHIFDEPKDDPYTLQSDFDDKPDYTRNREEISPRSFGLGRDTTPTAPIAPASRGVEPVKAQEPKKPAPPKPRVIKPYKRVPLDEFDCRDVEPTQDEAEVEETKQLIIATLEDFKVTGATIASVTFGPSVTRYNVALPRSVSPRKIVALDQSIAINLHSKEVNIYPNYEDGVVSIEVPNKERQFVRLGSMLSGNTFVNAPSSSLMFTMGKNVANAKVYGDISKMIHMLVAGSSGSGKSVFLGALITSLIYKYSPQELRLILIDPKKTEFVLYNNLPHLMINEIITDANKAVQSLNWAIGEMNRRYGLFEQMSRAGTYVVNLDEYNAQLEKNGQKNEKLPKLVIIIDELADLMLAAKKEMEDRIQNLTQKARAAGIHLIVATQRPSTDVITGVIKSNLATRIAFYVASDVDSRVILDQSGAQKLLGKGDLLYTMPGINTPVRVQSAFIKPEESQRVVNFIKANNEAYYDEEATAYINNTRTSDDDSLGGGDKSDVDPMYIEALRYVILSGSASISMIQRKCSAGYNRAGRIIEWMEEMGYISAFDGAKARKVLITKEEFESMYGPLQ